MTLTEWEALPARTQADYLLMVEGLAEYERREMEAQRRK